MEIEINSRCKKSKVLKQNKQTLLVKLYGEDFRIWRYGGIFGQDYWDRDVKNNVTSVGTDHYIGTNYNGLFAKYLFSVSFGEITQIRYSLLKKTKDYILVKIDRLQF